MDAVWTVIGVILLSGAAGGVANWILTSFALPPEEQPRLGLGGYVMVGVIAAFVVPLFLSMAQSALLEDAMGNTPFEPLMVLASFCILAAFSSRAFMTSMSRALLSRIEEANQNAAEAMTEAARAAAMAAEAERKTGEVKTKTEETAGTILEMLDNMPMDAGQSTRRKTPDPERRSTSDIPPLSLDIGEKAVLRAAARFRIRTPSGIARDARLAPEAVAPIVDSLVAKGLMQPTVSPRDGEPRLSLSTRGSEMMRE